MVDDLAATGRDDLQQPAPADVADAERNRVVVGLDAVAVDDHAFRFDGESGEGIVDLSLHRAGDAELVFLFRIGNEVEEADALLAVGVVDHRLRRQQDDAAFRRRRLAERRADPVVDAIGDPRDQPAPLGMELDLDLRRHHADRRRRLDLLLVAFDLHVELELEIVGVELLRQRHGEVELSVRVGLLVDRAAEVEGIRVVEEAVRLLLEIPARALLLVRAAAIEVVVAILRFVEAVAEVGADRVVDAVVAPQLGVRRRRAVRSIDLNRHLRRLAPLIRRVLGGHVDRRLIRSENLDRPRGRGQLLGVEADRVDAGRQRRRQLDRAGGHSFHERERLRHYLGAGVVRQRYRCLERPVGKLERPAIDEQGPHEDRFAGPEELLVDREMGRVGLRRAAQRLLDDRGVAVGPGEADLELGGPDVVGRELGCGDGRRFVDGESAIRDRPPPGVGHLDVDVPLARLAVDGAERDLDRRRHAGHDVLGAGDRHLHDVSAQRLGQRSLSAERVGVMDQDEIVELFDLPIEQSDPILAREDPLIQTIAEDAQDQHARRQCRGHEPGDRPIAAAARSRHIGDRSGSRRRLGGTPIGGPEFGNVGNRARRLGDSRLLLRHAQEGGPAFRTVVQVRAESLRLGRVEQAVEMIEQQVLARSARHGRVTFPVGRGEASAGRSASAS